MTDCFNGIVRDNKDERVYALGEFRAVRKKGKHGNILDKVYLYTNIRGGGDYYNTTAFAIFSSEWHLFNFLKSLKKFELEKKLREAFENDKSHTEALANA
jgi:hypothetical protein